MIHYTAVEDRHLVRFEVAIFNRDFVTLYTPTGTTNIDKGSLVAAPAYAD